ncbi:MAG TPA: hypothetical protein VFY68_17405 [Nitrososphaeraceae archaeon]|nr:hypothetical protein [Nitrososphaeraceae archaeon]
MKIYFAVALTSFILPLILNICVVEYQNAYAQLGISPGEVLFNKTNNNGANITNDNSSDDQIAVNVITPMPGVNSTLIGRSTPTTGNLSIEASNNTGGS